MIKHHAIKMKGKVDVSLQSFLTLVLDGRKWKIRVPADTSPGKEPLETTGEGHGRSRPCSEEKTRRKSPPSAGNRILTGRSSRSQSSLYPFRLLEFEITKYIPSS